MATKASRSRSLKTYQDKRDFSDTTEPAGRTATRGKRAKQPRFVVQEHSATAMHWDLRLEHEGVLLSWAVPKGIPAEPGLNRLAVRTEDHPLEYLDFEGDIPAGNYGAGSMRIWDAGTYEPEDEFDVEHGKVHVVFDGERTHGRYVLVRTKGDAREGTKEQWILKRLDPPEDPDREAMPEHVKPMLAKLAQLPAKPEEWAFEIKWDGIRALVFASGGRIDKIETRNLNDITQQYPELHRFGRAIGAHDAVLDGEIVAYDDAGRPSFQTLQARLGLSSPVTIKTRMAHTPVRFLAFDLLFLDGHDLTSLPYQRRRTMLRDLFEDDDHWQVPEHHVGIGRELLDAVVEQGLEGVVAKRLGSPYRLGSRGGDWLKIKEQQRQEFVIGGWAEGAGRRAGGIGAVLLGVYDDEGRFVHVGSVGTGFSDKELEELHARFTKLDRKTSPYDVNSPGTKTKPGKWQTIRGSSGPVAIHYVTPKLVCEVEFTEWTRDGTLRHPSYKGLRFDKDAKDVVREATGR